MAAVRIRFLEARSLRTCASVTALVAAGACSAAATDPDGRSTTTGEGAPAGLAGAEVSAAERVVASMRARFTSTREGAGHPVIGASMLDRVEPLDATHVVAIPHASAGAAPAARVALPLDARGPVLVSEGTGLSVGFELAGAAASSLEVAGGFAVYRHGGPYGAHLLHRVDANGTEDFLSFERRPAVEAIEYVVDVSRVAGLRAVGGVLEFLDDGGAPRLRMGAPYLVGATGGFTRAALSVTGCRADTSPTAPWGRPVTPPGSARCTVRVAWDLGSLGKAQAPVEYPALLDPVWTATATTMTITRRAHTATLLNDGRVLIAGGEHPSGASTTYLSSAEIYDAGTRSFAATVPMNAARSFHAASRLANGSVLVAGGLDGAGSVISSAEVFDPTTPGWTTTTSAMTTPRHRAQAVTLANGRVLIAGGLSTTFSVLSSAELYNPGASNFSASSDMLFRRFGHTLSLLDSGQALVVAGITTTSTSDLEQCELFEALTTQWNAATPLGTARYHHAAAKLTDGNVLVSGGYSRGFSSNISSSERFNASTGTWSSADSMNTRRQHHTMTALANGGALAVGGAISSDGTNVSTYHSSAEIYDATANRWSNAGTMSVPRIWHTATLLNDGKVLIAGGQGPLGTHASAETFAIDPLGSACTTGTSCASGFCVDGVCCDTDCSAGCFACTTALTGGTEGTCLPASAGTDPDSDCDDSGAPTCTLDGTCDGAGACAMYAAVPCTPRACTSGSDCASNRCYDGICCDTICSGTCEACTAALKGHGNDGVCEPILGGTDPENECASRGSGSCAGEGMCDGSGNCTAETAGTVCAAAACTDALTLSSEATCDSNGDCMPSFTQDCAPYVCDASSLQCSFSCTTASDCAPGLECTSGQCLPLQDGETCSNDGQCQSGQCVDDVCCSSSCTGQCEACDVAGNEGTCTAVTGDPVGTRSPCSGDSSGPCAGTCDGNDRNSCTYPDGDTVCGSDSTCEDGLETAARCDSSGSCGPSTADICSPFVCGPSACIRTCTGNSDCVTGYLCDSEGACQSENSRFCLTDSVVHQPGGENESCGAYKCVSGRCNTTCSDDDDCATGNICPPQFRTCGPAKSSDDGGCGCRAAGRDTPTRFGLLALLASGLFARRRIRRTPR